MSRAAMAVCVTFAAAIALIAPSAGAQATQPSAPVDANAIAATALWNDALARLADAIRGKDITALQSLLDRNPSIRNFSSDAIQPPERLLGAATGARLLGLHAYLKTPATLASDLSADFQNAADLPDATRERMTPADESAARKANETAGQWLAQVLQPAKDQPVGVIVLWREDRGDAFGAPRTRPTFVLVKGQIVDGACVIRQITFGDPLESGR